MHDYGTVKWASVGHGHTLQTMDTEEIIGTLFPLIMQFDFGACNHVLIIPTFDDELMITKRQHYYIDEDDLDYAKARAERIVYNMRANSLQRDIDALKVKLARTEALIEDTD